MNTDRKAKVSIAKASQFLRTEPKTSWNPHPAPIPLGLTPRAALPLGITFCFGNGMKNEKRGLTSVHLHSFPGCCWRLIHACGTQEHHVNPKCSLRGGIGREGLIYRTGWVWDPSSRLDIWDFCWRAAELASPWSDSSVIKH